MFDDADLINSVVVDGVATITLESVANRNALSGRLIPQLLDALGDATIDPEVHAVVITGEGPVFCSGADLDDPPSNDAGNRFSFPDVLQAMIACPKPVIAKVNGHARAGGLGLIAAADIAVAPHDATFAFSEVRLGLVPAIIAVVCRRVMNARSLVSYSLVGNTFDAAAAVGCGLLTVSVDRTAFETTFDALIADIHRTEPNAVGATKRLLARPVSDQLGESFAEAASVSTGFFDSVEGREGIAAFREKRAPDWAW